VISFRPQPLYPHGNSPWYPLFRSMGGHQSRSGRGGEEKIPSPIIQPIAQRYTTELSQLLTKEGIFYKTQNVDVPFVSASSAYECSL
jgi:hypothetical protein